jgi:hypothetical protein
MRAQGIPRDSNPDIFLQIETDRSTYSVGDPIRVRLKLKNRSEYPLYYERGLNYILMADLRLHDANGQEVLRAVHRVRGEGSGPRVALPGGAERQIMHWLDVPDPEWLNLRDWGYELRAPGTYTISGFPIVIPRDSAERSNRVQITIFRSRRP